MVIEGRLLPESSTEPVREFTLVLPSATLRRLSSPKAAAEACENDLSVLAVPWAKDQAAVSAMSSNCLWWQVSMAWRSARDPCANSGSALTPRAERACLFISGMHA